MDKKIISCNLHDYVEIACMYHLEVSLTLLNGEVVQGQAADVIIDDSRNECLLLEESGKTVSVVLNQVKTMTAISANPHFDSVKLQ